jgi:hypothetical protein
VVDLKAHFPLVDLKDPAVFQVVRVAFLVVKLVQMKGHTMKVITLLFQANLVLIILSTPRSL